MLLSELGEWKLIEKISKQFHRELPPGTLGIGDDTAVIPWQNETSLLVTTDLLIENTHFLRNEISAQDLGHKALAVNMSDIAAMGGKPTSAFLSLGLTQDLSVQWVEQFFEGFQKLADSFSVQLLGGDTTASQKEIVINVTLLGQIENQNLKLRAQAKAKDLVCVTGFLGDSAAGLKALLESLPRDSSLAQLIQRHHHPKPYVTEGQWLAQQSSVHAMMDISDGLNLTLKELARMSHCGFEISLNDLPISFELNQAALKFVWNPYEMAAAGGEDYSLLFTVAADDYSRLSHEYSQKFSQNISAVGKVTDQMNSIVYRLDGQPYSKAIQSWSHFKERSSSSS